MSKNQQIGTSVQAEDSEQPDDPRWYVQRIYDLAVEPTESSVAFKVVK